MTTNITKWNQDISIHHGQITEAYSIQIYGGRLMDSSTIMLFLTLHYMYMLNMLNVYKYV